SGVGGGPAGGARGTRGEIEDGARSGFPAAAALRIRGEHFVRPPIFPVDDERVAVAGARESTLDRCVRRKRIGSRVALAGVVEADGYLGLRAVDDDERDSVRRARYTVPKSGCS